MTYATPHLVLNWCRAYNSNLPVCLRMDAAFKLNHYQMCMNVIGFGSLGGHFDDFIYLLATTENEAGYEKMFYAGQSTVRLLLKNVILCKKAQK